MRKILALLAMCTTFVNADVLKIEPGLWESTITTVNPMTGKPVTEVDRTCVEVDSFEPQSMLQDVEECQEMRTELSGNTLTYALTCGQSGAEVSIQGRYEVNGDTGKGNMQMRMTIGAMKMESDTNWDSKRLGDC